MKRTFEELSTVIDARFYANVNQEILAIHSRDMLLDIKDSVAAKGMPAPYFAFKIKDEDLDILQNIEFEHTLNSMLLKAVIYNHENKRIYSPQFEFKPLTDTTVRFGFDGIPNRNYWKGFIYRIGTWPI